VNYTRPRLASTELGDRDGEILVDRDLDARLGGRHGSKCTT